MENDLKKSPYGVISLTLGIISLLTFPMWYLGLPASIIAMKVGEKGFEKHKSKSAKAGNIIGIIGLVLSIVATLIAAVAAIYIIADNF